MKRGPASAAWRSRNGAKAGVGRRCAIAAAVFLLGSASAAADVLVGAQGERIPGRLVEIREGFIVFDSDSFGRLQVREGQAHVERDTASTSVAPAASPAPSAWRADFNAKLGIDRGSLKTAEDDLDATLKLVRISPRGEWHASFDYSYKRTDGTLKDDDLALSLSYDHLLPERRFMAGRVLATTELTSEGYDATQTLSLAYGWRLWEGKERYLRIGPALGYLAMDRGDERFSGPAFGLYARGKGPVWRKLSYSSELQVLDSFGDGRYANLQLQLRHPLSEHLYLALAWDYVWSDVDIESGITSEWRWVLGWQSQPDAAH